MSYSLLTISVLFVDIAHINMVVNIVRYFISITYLLIKNQKECFGIFALPRRLDKVETNNCALSFFMYNNRFLNHLALLTMIVKKDYAIVT